MTNEEQLNDAIAELPGKTVAAKVMRLMPLIDQQVRAGVGHPAIVETMAQAGIDVKLETFRTYLYRYRRKIRASEAKAEKPAPQLVPQVSVPDGIPTRAPEPEAPAVSPVSSEELAKPFDTRRLQDVGDKYISKPAPLFGTGKRGNS